MFHSFHLLHHSVKSTQKLANFIDWHSTIVTWKVCITGGPCLRNCKLHCVIILQTTSKIVLFMDKINSLKLKLGTAEN